MGNRTGVGGLGVVVCRSLARRRRRIGSGEGSIDSLSSISGERVDKSESETSGGTGRETGRSKEGGDRA